MSGGGRLRLVPPPSGPGRGPEPPPPEDLPAKLRRWAEPALALALAALALRVGLPPALQGGPVGVVVTLFALPLLAWAWVALGRAAAPRHAAGPGVVEITEGRIAYFGPAGGGVVALSELAAVDVAAGPRPEWVLRMHGGPALRIPAGAAGAEALFDALAALPGFSEGRARACLAAATPAIRAVWRTPGA